MIIEFPRVPAVGVAILGIMDKRFVANRIDPFFFIEAVQPQSGHLSRLGGGSLSNPGVIAGAAEWGTGRVAALGQRSVFLLFCLPRAGWFFFFSMFLFGGYLRFPSSFPTTNQLYVITRRQCSFSLYCLLFQCQDLEELSPISHRIDARSHRRCLPFPYPLEPVRAPRLLGLAPLAPVAPRQDMRCSSP